MSSFTTPLRLEYNLRGEEPVYKLLEPFEYYTELVWNIEELSERCYIDKDWHAAIRGYTGYTYTPYTIIVPVGFVTNFASIPKIFHSILTPAGVHGKATVIHDNLYSDIKSIFIGDLLQCTSWTDMIIAQEFMEQSRELADNIFREAMEVLSVKPWKRNVMYTMVRLFGFNSILTGEKYD